MEGSHGPEAAQPDSPPPGDETSLAPGGERQTLEWLLLLEALDLPHRLLRGPDANAWRILVPNGCAEEAGRQIRLYERENAGWPPPPRPLPAPVQRTGWSAVWVAGLLVALYWWCGPYDRAVPLLVRAACDAERVQAGEWWRLLTSLGVHADVTHLAANVATTVAFGAAAATALGGGLAWSLALTCGALANLTSVWVGDGPRICFGASTAVFALLGLLAGRRLVQDLRARYPQRPPRQPSLWTHPLLALRAGQALGAGLCILVLLGTAPASDLEGHFYGFMYGTLGGAGTAFLPTRRPLPDLVQRLLEMAALALFMAAWRRAGLAV